MENGSAPGQAAHDEETLAVLVAAASLLGEAELADDAIPPLLRLLCDLTACVVGACWLPDPREPVLRCAYYHQAPPLTLAWFEVVTRDIVLAVGEGVVGRTWLAGAPEWSVDSVADPTFKRSLAARRCGLRRGFAVPALAAGAVRAVLEFYSQGTPRLEEPRRTAITLITARLELFLARLAAQQALARSEQINSLLLASAPVILLELDRHGTITASEGSALQLLGQMPGNTVGEALSAAYADCAGLVARGERALAGQTISATLRVRGLLCDLRCAPLRTAGDITGAVLLLTVRAPRSLR